MKFLTSVTKNKYQDPNHQEKKHKSMEKQFVDPDDSSNTDNIYTGSTERIKNDELDKYLRMNIEDNLKQSNPLPFWKHHQHKFPCLLLLAHRLFSIPVTLAAVERSFSAAELAVTERRSSLDSTSVNDILFVRSTQYVLEQNQIFFFLKLLCFFLFIFTKTSINKRLT